MLCDILSYQYKHKGGNIMIYVLSDIHGNTEAWNNIKRIINFCPNDTMIINGDVIDRNPGGIDILEEIMDTPNMHLIMGNHEYMMYLAMKYNDSHCIMNWFDNGGDITLMEFHKRSKEQQDKILNYLIGLPQVVKISVNGITYEISHAAPKSTHEEDDEYNEYEFVLWDRTRYMQPTDLGHPFIFGHTPVMNIVQDANEILLLNHNWYAIDCGAAYPTIGRLGCLRLDDLKDFYSDQIGS